MPNDLTSSSKIPEVVTRDYQMHVEVDSELRYHRIMGSVEMFSLSGDILL